MTGRAKIGFGDPLADLGDFAPQPKARANRSGTDIAAAAGFVSREPVLAVKQRRHRTGRSAQINIKAKPETIEALYAWADAQGISVAEAFERLIASLPKM